MKDNKNTHLTLSDRQIIENGINNGSTKTAIANVLGKDKSTICKEIKLHRTLSYKSTYDIDCSKYSVCKRRHTDNCNNECPEYQKYRCVRRDRSPGACNGCEKYNHCRYDKYRYISSDAEHEYRLSLVETRSGVNATLNEIKELGLILKPLMDKGQSIYAILNNHPEITYSEKTIYAYIKDNVFQDAGVSITLLDLKRQVRRKVSNKKVKYAKRQDRTYLKGRTQKEYTEYISNNPNASIVEMDTVYNDITNGPFIQTFKFLDYDLLFCVYHTSKDSKSMLNGILLLEKILGEDLFNETVSVIKTDRGSEFVLADNIEIRDDGSRRTRVYYCDPMAACQKGSLENIHILLREICPKNTDLYNIGLTSQDKANIISSHINSYPKEKLKGRNSFELLEFLNMDLANKFYEYGLSHIAKDSVALKPYILRNK